MDPSNEMYQELTKLVKRLNEPAADTNSITSFLKHPIVVTTVTSLLVLIGSNMVAKAFQLRDKQSDVIAALETEMPKTLKTVTKLAVIRSVLEDQKCDENSAKKLEFPYVIGLTNKTCGQAEAEFDAYYKTMLEHPPAPPLARIRALFKSKAINQGAKKLSVLVDVLSNSAESSCIVVAEDQAQDAYETLVELALKEIDGTTTDEVPAVFNISKSLSHCTQAPLCNIPSVREDSDMKAQCAKLNTRK